MSEPMHTVYVPRDAAALSVGADAVAAAIRAEAVRRNIPVRIVRNGSRGMLWLEPLVEVVTQAGRVAYGPVTAEDVPALFDAGFLSGAEHPLGHGLTEAIPYFARQERLTFARCGLIDPLSVEDYRAHGGFRGLERALAMTADGIVAEVTESGLRGRGGAGFPTGIKWKTVQAAQADEKFICCNADENVEANLTLLQDLCEVMVDGSLCAMGGMTPVPVRSALKHFAEDFLRTPAAVAAE